MGWAGWAVRGLWKRRGGRAQAPLSHGSGDRRLYVQSNRYTGRAPSLGWVLGSGLEEIRRWDCLREVRWATVEWSQALSRGSEWSVRAPRGRVLDGGGRNGEVGLQRTDSRKERRQCPNPPARAKSYSMVQCGGGVRRRRAAVDPDAFKRRGLSPDYRDRHASHRLPYFST